MWPYNEDEAGWLKPRERDAPPGRVSANDNDPTHRVPGRGLSKTAPTLPPKT